MGDMGSINPESKVVARGNLNDFSTAAILQALSISRQYTAVDFYLRDGSVAGRVLLKSGMVLGAQLASDDVTGIVALQILLHEPLSAFQVERLKPPTEYPSPIAQLSSRVLSTLTRSAPPGGAPASIVTGAEAAPSPAPVAKPATRPQEKANGASAAQAIASQPAGGDGSPVPIIAVASPKGGCGKTTIALNLAVSLARAGLRVVLVDSDPNGDILSAVGGRERARSGIYDVLAAGSDPSALAIRTAIERLVLVPALGHESELSDLLFSAPPDRRLWAESLRHLSANAQVVVVDTPAGMLGASAHVLGACTHVLGVLQAETISQRSFGIFDRALASMGDAPDVLGVVLNMVRTGHRASLLVLADASSQMPEERLFQVSIPRSDVFLEASVKGAPVAHADRDTEGIAGLFDTLAGEVISRLELDETSARSRAASFLL